jgi:hypothetical protein
MSPALDTNDLERLLREATHEYTDGIDPSPDSWAQLRARANEVQPTDRMGWLRTWGVGALVGAAAATVVAVATTGTFDSKSSEGVDVAAQPTIDDTTFTVPTTVAVEREALEVPTTVASNTVPATTPTTTRRAPTPTSAAPVVTTPATSPVTTPVTTPTTAPAPTPTTSAPTPLTPIGGDLTASFTDAGSNGTVINGHVGFTRTDGDNWTGSMRVRVSGSSSPGVLRLLIGRPLQGSSYQIHFTDVCSAVPDANGAVECTASFSGAANQWTTAFGPGNGQVYLQNSSGSFLASSALSG